jgi:uncharacterized repeat protein (TIGR03803 family)
MKQLVSLISILLLSLGSSTVALNSPTPPPTYEILHSFTGNDNHGFTGDTDGANPYGPLVQLPDGTFYGTTVTGSASQGPGNGTVFKMDTSGKLTVIHHFTTVVSGDGANPYGGLVLAKDGNLYGTTYSSAGVTGGGNGGVIYRITPAGSYTKLWSFTGVEGGMPKSGLIQAKDGLLYGASTKGGYLAGAVYRAATNGKPSLLHGFKGPEGTQPTCELLQAKDGNFYGTTYSAGPIGFGTIFKLTPTGGFSVIHEFKGPAAADGSNPIGGLTQTSDGSLFGTTATGGKYNLGSIYKFDPTGNYSVVYSLTVTDGGKPFGNLLLASDGNLYGTTYTAGAKGYGTIFKLTMSGQLTVVHSFPEMRGDGGSPASGVIQGLDGKLYGTTYIGGSQNKGIVYRLDLGLPPLK